MSWMIDSICSKTISSFGIQGLRQLDALAAGSVWDIGTLEGAEGVSHYLLREELLSLDLLQAAGLIKNKVVSPLRRDVLLHEAYRNFTLDYDFLSYAFGDHVQAGVLYQLFSQVTGERDWRKWAAAYRDYPQGHGVNLKLMEEDLFYLLFLQYQVSLAWKKFSRSCHQCGVKVVVHVPFPIVAEKVDAWYQNPLYDAQGGLRWNGADHVLLDLLEFYDGLADGVCFDGIEVLQQRRQTAIHFADIYKKRSFRVRIVVGESFDARLAEQCGFQQFMGML